jgi:hypothetical protein
MNGWYYEEGTVQSEDSDVWDVIQEAVTEGAEEGRLDRVKVGPMVDYEPSDFLDDDDIFNLVADDDERLTAERICECIDAQLYDLVTDGYARLKEGATAPEFDPAKPEEIRAWADANIVLEPSRVCDGRYPLPIDYVDGKWRFGAEILDNIDAVITYSTEPDPETGHEGWCWTIPDINMGEAKTLKEAMRAAEEALGAKNASGE